MFKELVNSSAQVSCFKTSDSTCTLLTYGAILERGYSILNGGFLILKVGYSLMGFLIFKVGSLSFLKKGFIFFYRG